MNWKYVKPLKSEMDIKEFEEKYHFEFPDSFKETVKKYNGARPEKDIYNTDKTKERTIKSLLSFNKEDRETIWKINEWNTGELGDKYVAFALDQFGNLICFSRSDKSIIFINTDFPDTENISTSFSDFIDKLYTLD